MSKSAALRVRVRSIGAGAPRSRQAAQSLTLPAGGGDRSRVHASSSGPMRQPDVVRPAMRRHCPMPGCTCETAADTDHRGLPRSFVRLWSRRSVIRHASTPFGALRKNRRRQRKLHGPSVCHYRRPFTTTAIPAVVLFYYFSCHGELVFALLLSLPRRPSYRRYQPEPP